MGKSFLLLFFKKEALAFFTSPATPAQAAVICTTSRMFG
jgi:hypothetical protein